MKILFLVPYPLREAPSQRFRFEQYFGILSSKDILVTTQSFINSQNWQIIYSNGNIIKKLIILISGFARRLWILLRLFRFDFVFIHREAAPFGPPIIEWLISRVFRKRIIYDFDDAIWNTDKVSEGTLEKLIRYRIKVKYICKWSYKISCGNEYLCDYAKQFNNNVILNPTTIDTKNLHNPDLYKKRTDEKIIVGWTGSHSTLKYLNILIPVFQKLEKKYSSIQFLIIANKKPDIYLSSLIYIPWAINSEIEDLNKIDIGIMPLPDDEWSKGKCGFKLLQYMALGIPSLASPVGVNTEIIKEEVNGFLCSTEQKWISDLERLINDANLRSSIGENGKEWVEKNYSVLSNADNFLSLFD